MKPFDAPTRGSAHHKALWTDEEAARIRQECRQKAAAGRSWRSIAREYGIHRETLRRLVDGLSYRDY